MKGIGTVRPRFQQPHYVRHNQRRIGGVRTSRGHAGHNNKFKERNQRNLNKK
ncbi:MAG: hypothetical protein SFT92_02040 [Rickettsiales bacterium]|nr:hypothetical protein [Rickettsiales bacterium]